MLNQLRDLGIEINIDDFGTGYSNLGYLRKLPVSALKIDRTFVSMIDEEGGNDEIVRAIVTLARNLGLKVVAEGVENEIQLNVLRELDCENAQGYYFARPMRFEDLTTYLTERAGTKIPEARPSFDEVTVSPLVQ
jgi:EAL domain-containing protein (putative c-di-GMP-specific phosphodiesterase class I)